MKTFSFFIRLLMLLNFAFTYSQQSWSPTSLVNAPSPRVWHKAVWTGSEMIIWGGQSNFMDVNTGGVYNLASNSWTHTSTTNAPTGREIHTAIWTGSKMIIWGGACFTCGGDTNLLNTGGIYDPVNDTWVPTSTVNAPSARVYHTAVWTGSKMIIWGGTSSIPNDNTGGIFDPETNTWTPTSTINAPAERYWHTAVWTGSKMIIWGGALPGDTLLNTGGIYDPITDNWQPTDTTNAPSPRIEHTAVWSGNKMIVWCGGTSNGYDNTGGIYAPVTNTWSPTSLTNAPSPRIIPTAIWTGIRMVIWGGIGEGSYVLNTGGIYDTATNAWSSTTLSGAPSPRCFHTAVWTGSKMIIWGGVDANNLLNSGGVYSNPAIIGLINNEGNLPKEFKLEQNYPNPFNPSTKIRFDIPVSGQKLEYDTRLVIYDMLGREILSLVKEPLNPGAYEVEWDASNYPSGIYFYMLQSGNQVDTKKMVLVK